MKHPKGLYLLFATEMAERFSYYGMRALFTLYLVAAFFNSTDAFQIYGSYTGLVYLTPLLGGYIADRYWGNRRSIIVGGMTMAVGQFMLFLSACFARQSIFTPDGTPDPAIDNTLSVTLMFAGLAALIIGNGFFKPNISTMVGDLYEPQDNRKDSAFTIFYMGINIGAFFAPFVCGALGNGNWADVGAFKWGFFAAAIAMLLSVLIFILLKDRYLVTPDGKGIGLKPDSSLPRKEKDTTTQATASDTPERKNSPVRLTLCAVLEVALFCFFAMGAEGFNDYITAAIYSISISLPIFIITDRSLTKAEKCRIAVIFIVAVFVIFFWSAFEQAGSSLTIFAERQCDRTVGSFEVPTTWFQSVNPISVVCCAPLMAMMWEWLMKRGINVHSLTKQAIGLVLLAIGYLVIAFATSGVDSSTRISMWWLVTLYFIHSIGELSLSPIGLSLVNQLSPARLASLLMGVWFMSNATSNVLAGQLATLLPESGSAPKEFLGMQIATLSDFFMLFAIMAGISAVLLFCLIPWMKKMMK